MLHENHRAEWEASAVSPAIIERNVWTITDPRELDQLLNRNTDKRWKHSLEQVPGWAVAGVALDGERTFSGAQFKPNHPRPALDRAGNLKLDADGNPKVVKYESPVGNPLAPLLLDTGTPDYWANLLIDLKQLMLLTEGAKKAGASLTAGVPCISIPGVTTGQKLGRLRPELEAFCKLGRRMVLGFDADILTKRPVQNALDQLGRLMSAAGAVVSVLELPPETKGLDDFCALDPATAPERLRALIAEAPTLEEWREKWRDEQAEEVEEVPCALARRFKQVQAKIGKHLRWNEMKQEIELLGAVVDMDELQLTLALQYNIQMPESDCIKIVTALAKRNSYHPVAEYLERMGETLPADGDLLDKIAPKYFGTADPLHIAFVRKTLIAAVARALHPGAKVDTVLILQGAQGVGKSTWFQRLMPNPEWFDDSLGAASEKDERLKLHQAWVLEWGELERLFRKRDISQVKAFISCQVDYLRPPYGRTIKAFKRRSILVGSTNDDEFLMDATGNRRFWVVPVAQAVPLAELEHDRHRIWAAAYHAYKAGERWELPPELRPKAVEAAATYEVSDPWADVVLNYCEALTEVQVHEVLGGALKLEYSQQDRAAQNRVGAILRQAGWISRRAWIGGKRPRVWSNPEFLNVEEEDGSDGSTTQESSNGKGVEVIHPLIHPPTVIHQGDGSTAQKRSTDPSDPSDPSRSTNFYFLEKTSHAPSWAYQQQEVCKRGKKGWRGRLVDTDSSGSPLVHWYGDPKPSLCRWHDLAPYAKEVAHA